MPLTSASTLAEIDTELATYLNYTSVAEARLLRSACLWWRLKHPSDVRGPTLGTSYDAAMIDKLMSDVDAYLAAASRAARNPVSFGFEEYRT